MNITCSTVDNPVELQESIHIYLTGTHCSKFNYYIFKTHCTHYFLLQFIGKNELKNQEKTLEINYSPENSSTMLPCRPSSPNITVVLEHQSSSSETSEWEPVDTAHANYDPKQGFSLKKSNDFDLKSSSLFRCSANSDKPRYTFFNFTIFDLPRYTYFNITITDQPLDKSYGFNPKEIIQNNASFTLTNCNSKTSLRAKVTCCSGISKKPPKLFVLPCYSHSMCTLFQQMLPWHNISLFIWRVSPARPLNNSTDCVESAMLCPAEIVMCHGDME